MNNRIHTVAIDVGNSAVKIAIRINQTMAHHSIGIGPTGWEQQAIQWVQQQLGARGTCWRVASVHQAAAMKLERAIGGAKPDADFQLITHHDVPMPANVDHPERLGIDRLLGAYAAMNQLGPGIVVVDAGTAVTVDWVDQQGEFSGGVILPGLGLQSRSLQRETEALPQIDWDHDKPTPLPAKNTVDAIRSGILVGISAAIDEFIGRYRHAATSKHGGVEVALTGGDAATVSRNLKNNHHVIPNLVCRGLLDLPRSLETRPNLQSE